MKRILLTTCLFVLLSPVTANADERLSVREAKAAIKKDVEANKVTHCRRIHIRRISCTAKIKDAGEIVNEDTGEVVAVFDLDLRMVASLKNGKITVDWPYFESETYEEHMERIQWEKGTNG